MTVFREKRAPPRRRPASPATRSPPAELAGSALVPARGAHIAGAPARSLAHLTSLTRLARSSRAPARSGREDSLQTGDRLLSAPHTAHNIPQPDRAPDAIRQPTNLPASTAAVATATGPRSRVASPPPPLLTLRSAQNRSPVAPWEGAYLHMLPKGHARCKGTHATPEGSKTHSALPLKKRIA